jgi:hypothetical protein
LACRGRATVPDHGEPQERKKLRVSYCFFKSRDGP